ncbi:MAG: DNA polymerase III subunit gamma/tau C-terminal domain-containing protein, partial [Pseudomonadales bacterium]
YQSLLVGKRDLALAPDPITGIEMIVLRLFAFRIAPADVHLEQAGSQPISQSAPQENAQSGSQNEEVTSAKKLVAETVVEPTADAVLANNLTAQSAQLSEPVLSRSVASQSVVSEPVASEHVGTTSFVAEPQNIAPPSQSPAASMRDNFDATPAYSAPPEVGAAQTEDAHAAIVHEPIKVNEPVNVHEPAVNAQSPTSDEGTNPALDTLTPLSWCEMFAALPLSGVVRTVASYCVPIENSDDGATGQVVFALADDNATLFNDEHPARLAKGLSIYYGKPLTIKINIVEDWSSLALPDNVETPADYRLRIKAEVQGEALASIQGDDNVKSIIDAFDGELDTDTVRSL